MVPTRCPTWLKIFAGVWAAGTLAILATTGLTFAAGVRRLRRDACWIDRRLQRMAWLLARRLGLRRRVRLVVSESRIGPAVFGLVRPTVLLPEAIIRGCSPDEIEPILAHELIHVRRGDLWVGLLQTVAQAIWWFHPGVWWAGRLIYRDAERCCDEAVVAELRCSPSRYARSLLEVLARKQDLVALPSVPGVRPVELTSKRMERIMKLGQGCRGRSPWWCWTIMLVAAAVVLPGAARMVAAENAKAKKTVSSAKPEGTSQGAVVPTTVPIGAGAGPAKVQSERQIERVYRVADIVRSLSNEFNLDEAKAQNRLASILANADISTSPDNPSAAPRGERFAWTDGRLVVTAPKSSHDRIQKTLKSISLHGLNQISIEVSFVTVPSSVADAATIPWQSVFAEAPPAPEGHLIQPPPKDIPLHHANRARTVREKTVPIRLAILKQDEIVPLTKRLSELESREYHDRETLVDRVQKALGYQTKTAAGRQEVTVLHAPLVTLLEGQQGILRDCSQSPFVVDLKKVTGPYATACQPVIQILEEGVKVELRAQLRDSNNILLTCRAKFSRIGEVDTMTTTSTDVSEPVTVQIPEHEITELLTNVILATDEAIVIDGPRTKGRDGRLLSSLVVVAPTKVVRARKQPITQTINQVSTRSTLPQTKSEAASQRYVVVYDVGDLVIPIPDFVDASPRENATRKAEVRKKMTTDFQPLIDQITSNVRPASWTTAGGHGTIKPYENNLTLVINQTEEVHGEIVDLLAKFRRLQDVQVMLEARLIDMPEKTFRQSGIEFDTGRRQITLGPKEAKLFTAQAQNAGRANIRQCPRVTLFNGQEARFGFFEKQPGGSDKDAMLCVQPIASKDRQSVCLTLATTAGSAGVDVFSENGIRPADVPRGQTLLVDVTGLVEIDTSGKTMSVNITPGIKWLKAGAVEMKDQRVFVSITPTVVLAQEENDHSGTTP